MANNEKIYVDFHVIQTVPPSCVNRDDTGSPKTAVYGGATRARVSSQAWKRAMRLMFKDMLSEGDVGVRTKMIADLVAEEIQNLSPNCSEKDAQAKAKAVLESAGLKLKEDKKKEGKSVTGALFFISPAQIHALAEIAVEQENNKFDKKICANALSSKPGYDMALFGRMVADDPSLNFDAAAQVAHAISTHAVENEFDYFTAVDDCSPEDNAGAGHLGTVEFNSSTLYRYATVNVTELEKMLEGRAFAAVRTFAEAFIRSMPTGKQNTFANRTRPDAVYVTVRRDQPVNMAGAFEKPVRAGKEGYVENSINNFVEYAKETYDDFVSEPEFALAVGRGMEKLTETVSVDALLDALEAHLKGDEEQ